MLHLLSVVQDNVSRVQEEHCLGKRWIIVLGEQDNFLVLL